MGKCLDPYATKVCMKMKGMSRVLYLIIIPLELCIGDLLVHLSIRGVAESGDGIAALPFGGPDSLLSTNASTMSTL